LALKEVMQAVLKVLSDLVIEFDWLLPSNLEVVKRYHFNIVYSENKVELSRLPNWLSLSKSFGVFRWISFLLKVTLILGILSHKELVIHNVLFVVEWGFQS
jgi:hypothetical protein